MKTEIRSKKEIRKYPVYISDDGTEFDNQYDCEEYERKQIIEEHNITHVDTISIDEYPATLWLIQNENEWKILLKTEFAHSGLHEHQFTKPGWYIAIKHDGGDWHDWYEFCLLDKYIEEYEELIQHYKILTDVYGP